MIAPLLVAGAIALLPAQQAGDHIVESLCASDALTDAVIAHKHLSHDQALDRCVRRYGWNAGERKLGEQVMAAMADSSRAIDKAKAAGVDPDFIDQVVARFRPDEMAQFGWYGAPKPPPAALIDRMNALFAEQLHDPAQMQAARNVFNLDMTLINMMCDFDRLRTQRLAADAIATGVKP